MKKHIRFQSSACSIVVDHTLARHYETVVRTTTKAYGWRMAKFHPTTPKPVNRLSQLWPIDNVGVSNHITGTAEPKVVKCCTQVCYINSSNRMTDMYV